MSGTDLQERLARHRGFAIKAREVLLEPSAPFAVVSERARSLSDDLTDSKLPHRGFTAKARGMLLERQARGSQHSSKCFLEAILSDICKCNKQQSHSNHGTLEKLPVQQTNIGTFTSASDETAVQQTNTGYEKRGALIPRCKLSRIKAHKLLGETGRSRSVNEIFYDKCVQRERNPLLRSNLETERSD